MYIVHLVEAGVDQGGDIVVVWNRADARVAMDVLQLATYYLKTREVNVSFEMDEFILECAVPEGESDEAPRHVPVQAAHLRRTV